MLYEPINRLKPVAENLWIVDGPIVKMSLYGAKVPFPTRMTIIRLRSGDLMLHSPTEPVPQLRDAVEALGPVRHLLSPNKIHYEHIGAWKAAYPGAVAWASRGVRARARSQHIEVAFDRDLGDEAPADWAEEVDQLILRGSRVLKEVAFFHRASRTLILADMIENFEREKVPRRLGWLLRLSGAVDPDGKAPLDLRLTFLGRKPQARAGVERMLAWHPERVIIAHGRWYPRDGEAELRRAFRWLDLESG